MATELNTNEKYHRAQGFQHITLRGMGYSDDEITTYVWKSSYRERKHIFLSQYIAKLKEL